MALHEHCPATPVPLGSRRNLTRSSFFFYFYFFYSLSPSLKVIFAPSSVCLSYSGNVPGSDVFRDICGRANWALFSRRRRPPYDISVTGTLEQSDSAADEEVEKKKDDSNAGKTDYMTEALSERQTATRLLRVCAVVSDCSACAHACDVALIK